MFCAKFHFFLLFTLGLSIFFRKFAPMKLIADSGSTKTSWVIAEGGSTVRRVSTAGINPVVQGVETIVSTLRELASQLDGQPTEIHFFGAGCRGEACLLMRRCLAVVFPDAVTEVESDLLGAARALFDDREGIACILGTGSNSCLYDGKGIVENVPPLGFILGDEGSGAALGKAFINALFKGDLPEDMRRAYLEETGQTYEDIIRRVYREPNANRYLATTSLFISKHLDFKPLADIVEQNIECFFTKNVDKYGRRDVPVGAVGSIAYVYADTFRKVAERHGYRVEHIVKEPIEMLVKVV